MTHSLSHEAKIHPPFLSKVPVVNHLTICLAEGWSTVRNTAKAGRFFHGVHVESAITNIVISDFIGEFPISDNGIDVLDGESCFFGDDFLDVRQSFFLGRQVKDNL